jgi:hypothetical protein
MNKDYPSRQEASVNAGRGPWCCGVYGIASVRASELLDEIGAQLFADQAASEGDLMSALADSLYAVADQYHLVPLVAVFIFLGVLTAVSMAVRFFLGFLEENQRAILEFRARWDENKCRHEQSLGK